MNWHIPYINLPMVFLELLWNEFQAAGEQGLCFSHDYMPSPNRVAQSKLSINICQVE